MKKKVNLILVSQSSAKKNILKTLAEGFNNNYDVLCLSSHMYLEFEEAQILAESSKSIIFKNFSDYLNEKEMVFCDEQADKDILLSYKSRKGKINEYYNRIKYIKNQVLYKNVTSEFELQESYILSSDLGICKDIWLENNLSTRFLDEPKNSKYIKLASSLRKFTGFFITSINQSVSTFECEDGSHVFFGHTSRLNKYFKKHVSFKKLNYVDAFFIKTSLMILLTSKKIPVLKYFLYKFIGIFKSRFKSQYLSFDSSIHEYSDNFGDLAKLFNIDMHVYQDGLLPGNYSSKYLLYYQYVDSFLVWDDISSKILKKNNQNVKKSNVYQKDFIDNIHAIKKVKKILYIASGSGDWTAVKTRTDEDKAFDIFMKSALQRQDIKFIFRPHPLWEHAKHQGLGSIKRLMDYADKYGPKNLHVSRQAYRDSKESINSSVMAVKSNSLQSAIEQADIIIGDHSESLLDSLRQGKIVASLNTSKRESLFQDFIDLGFPLLSSSCDILNFIDLCEQQNFVSSFNKSINIYNNKSL